jgi:hypothetical protein
MNVNITVNLPSHADERLRTESGDLSIAARDAFAIEFFRRGMLSHFSHSGCVPGSRVERPGPDVIDAVAFQFVRHVVANLGVIGVEMDRQSEFSGGILLDAYARNTRPPHELTSMLLF